MEDEPIINRVAKSPLVSIDLEEYFPSAETFSLDLADFLFQRMLLKESDFRAKLKAFDFEVYNGKAVRVYCSEEAIIPAWALMLVASYLHGIALVYVFGTDEVLQHAIIDFAIDAIPSELYVDKKVIIKGCGSLTERDYAYMQVSKKMLPHVSSLMYGEPCSTVPVFKRKK